MKKSKIVGIGIIGIIGFILVLTLIPKNNSIHIKFYNYDKKPLVMVGPTEGLVTPNVSFMKLGVSTKNTGENPLICEIIKLETLGEGITTNFFKKYMNSETKHLEPNEKVYWVTDLINVRDILSQSNEVTFKVEVNCHSENFSKTKENQITLKFFPEGTPQGSAEIMITNE